MTRRDGKVGRDFRAVIEQANRGRLLGVEREYEVFADQRLLDARTLWPDLLDAGARLDPGDPNARRGPSGGVVTADGPHAEVATPPVVCRPGCTTAVLALAAAGERHLAGLLGERRLEGYSTHISLEVPDRRVSALAALVARRLALPIMLALDRPTSPGLLVRPRPGRLEIGGEFAAGDQLRAAIALTIAMVLVAESGRGLRGRWLRSLPEARVVPAVQRYGWFVDRRAFGPDLYAEGRNTRLGALTAGAVLIRLWDSARTDAQRVLAQSEIDLVDRVVIGSLPLPLEQPMDDDGVTADVPKSCNYGPRNRSGIEVQVLRATWWRAVLEIRGPGATRWLTVPGRGLDSLLNALDRGTLDADLHMLTGPGRR